MSALADTIKNALSLDVDDRATLAERLLASLDELSDEEAERLWAAAAQKRLQERRAGRADSAKAKRILKRAGRGKPPASGDEA